MTCQQTLPDKVRVARSFGNAATSYDRHAFLQRDIGDMLLACVDDRPANAILDVGSGTGYCAGRLAGRFPGASVNSLDIAEAMLEQARHACPENAGAYICGDAEALPFADESFDLVMSNLTLQWCERPANFFRELYRVMQPGGRAWVSTLAEHTLKELKDSWRQVDGYVHVNEFLPVSAINTALAPVPFARTECRHSQEIYYYDSLTSLTRELKGIGAHNLNAGQSAGLTGKDKLKQLKNAFEAGLIPGKGIPVTYDVVLLCLEKQGVE